MHRFLSSIRHGRGSSLISLLAPKPSLPSNAALRHHRFSLFPQNDEYVRGFSSVNRDWRRNNLSQNVNENVNSHRDFIQDLKNINSRSGNNLSQNVNENSHRDFVQDLNNINSRSGNNLSQNANANTPPDFMNDKENINFRSGNDAETGQNSRPMDFVRGIIEDDNVMRVSSQYHYEQDADFVHIKMLRNNTFVTVTDSKGNIKLSGSAGSLKEMKAGQKLSRYAAEATAEVVGRRARGLGLKSVVMKVNGFTHFRRKRQAIMSWREGFTDSREDRNPIVFIEDTTRKPHNGCRLPKKRRI
ncbi:probable ribosomal protein S11, mitochondrial isoform X2 [Abrus precatorius]|uniref:Probable ribosomal protein S11, mitochondrial isoform X2 n=1 Tax=Abrus precatorius TaxID=3816 RepID=A0A8B8LU68_ABRPR|nr:probable ribosomal protein S11, mitochondrial isoform X2 [Abrus precatorius]